MPNNVPIHPEENEAFLADVTPQKEEIQVVRPKSQKWEEWKKIFKDNFDFRQDKEKDSDILIAIQQEISFRGTKLWVLVCAILVASLGLNLNSTAVVIGAMCISPLMGPIVGFGTALVIDNFDLLKRSLKNLLIMTLFSVVTATLYFLISPLTILSNELLARTSPTIYDVLIAFFGGAAGMIAICTKSKGLVLPGVAIATALMPPLCTAGFGLANAEWSYFAGALYLFVINSVFIAFSTFLVGRILRLPRKTFSDVKRGKKMRRIIAIITVCTVIPSIYFGIRLVSQSMTEYRIEHFVKESFDFPSTSVLSQQTSVKDGRTLLKLVLVGEQIDSRTIDSIKRLMPKYDLRSVDLVVQQGFGSPEEMDMGELCNVLLKDFYENSNGIIARQSNEIDSLKQLLSQVKYFQSISADMQKEATVLFPGIKSIQFISTNQLEVQADSVIQVVVRAKERKKLNKEQLGKLSEWIEMRTGYKHAHLIIDESRINQKAK